jgi:molecular chaperone DnaK
VEGRKTMPSAISVRPDGTVLVGQQARSRAKLAREQCVTSAKRFIGDGETEWHIRGKTYSPLDVSAIVLRKLKQAAEDYLGQTVKEAVITVPAYFNNNQKRDTKLAGEAAGLKVLQLLPEPTAAAISYGLDKGKDQTLLIYDLGGGTFDVSILTVKGNRFKVVAVDGDFQLGGDDFDLALVDYLVGILDKKTKKAAGLRNRFFDRGNNGPATQEILVAQRKLKEAAEMAKLELSEADAAEVMIPDILGVSLCEEIDLQTYNELIAPFAQRTVRKIRDVLRAARFSADDIHRVILVGGSTRNRLIRDLVAEEVKEPYISERVDEVVAEGAAIVASYQAMPDQDLAPIEFVNVTPFDLGVRASKDSDQDVFKVLIPKNTSVPAEVAEGFTTYRANQKSVDIAVFQGASDHCRDNTFVGSFRLEGIPPAPAKLPDITVTFAMDNSDLFTVAASCNDKHSEKTLDVNMVAREEEMQAGGASADIVFLIDTSGSMATELEGVKSSCDAFANQVNAAGVDCRLGLVDFDKGWGREYKWEVFPPMEASVFKAAIAKLRICRLGGLGCYIPELETVPVVEAFVSAFAEEGRLKIGILISDEVGNNVEGGRRISKILQGGQVCLHVIGVPRSFHVEMAEATGGRFWNISESRRLDFSALLDDIAVEITNLALR